MCGHVGQNISVTLRGEEMKISAGTVNASVIDYSSILLQEADKLLTRDKQFALAIVVAHTACEVATQRAFTRGFGKMAVPELDEPISDLFTSLSVSTLFDGAPAREIDGRAV